MSQFTVDVEMVFTTTLTLEAKDEAEALTIAESYAEDNYKVIEGSNQHKFDIVNSWAV